LISPLEDWKTGDRLKFEVVATGPRGRELYAAFEAHIVEPPPAPEPDPKKPQLVDGEFRTGQMRRPPYQLKVIKRDDYEQPCWNAEEWTQGGEPLLNFPLIEHIVLAAKSARSDKKIDFVIASNLALLTDEHLAFCKSHDLLLSTSLDGPADLHNKNRPRPGGNSHELAVRGIRRAQEFLGKDRVSALMTTTERSLSRVTDIIDEYLCLGLDGIFLRPLSPYGFAETAPGSSHTRCCLRRSAKARRLPHPQR
jgi:hypothetical protein